MWCNMFLWLEKLRILPSAILTAPIMILVAVLILFNAVTIDGAGPKINRRTGGPKINNRQKEKQILDQILTGDYDRQIRPSGANGTGATVVSVNLYLRSIDTIDDYKMEYSVQLTFREQWLDDRLQFDTLKEYMELGAGKLRYLTLSSDSSRVWMPDLFFSNEKQGHLHNLIKPNVYVRIFPDGEVLYSIRISLTLSCPMILKLYPMDKQTCSLRMASYSWTTEDIIFKWKRVDPVQVSSSLHLPRFALQQFRTDYCDSPTNTGIYSCLRVDFLFKREIRFYLIQVYIPCVMLVIVSWVSFWLDERALEARVSLGVTTLLTMATQISGINQNMPPVSYTKAIDVWTIVCLAFVFGSLLECAIVQFVSRWDKRRESVVKKQQGESDLGQAADLEAAARAEYGMTLSDMNPMERRPLDTMSLDRARSCEMNVVIAPKRGGAAEIAEIGLCKSRSRSKIIDVVSRIIFPLTFALFNFAYWSFYLREEEAEIG